MAALKNELGWLTPSECPPKGLDEPEGVFALDEALKIEHEEEKEPVLRQAELRSRHGRVAGEIQRMRHTYDRLLGCARDCLQCERARYPDLVERVEALPPLIGKVREFPRPVADVVAPFEVLGTTVSHEAGNLVGVHVHEI